jgi:CRISPR type III-B/RAMP module-associated protein Cmr3
MGGVFLGQQEGNHLTFLLPTPADLFYSKDDDIPYLPSPTENLITNVQLSADFRFLSVKEGYENLPHSWMTLETFKQYLNHELPTKDNILAKDDIYDTESRFGVSTDSKTSFREEGQLYQIQFVRPKEGICLLVKVDDIPTHLLEGMLQLGGEGRQAYIAPIKNLPFLDRPQQVSGSFKVIFLTPAYFNAGWQPQAENWSALFGGEVMLKSASLYRPLKIGGWSNADRSPRAMYNYVAPGSVYYFEAKETIHLPATLTENPAGIQSERLGFGQYAISRY